MLKLLKIGAVAAVVVSVLAWPAAWYLDSTAQEVFFISRLDDAAIEANQFIFEDDAKPNPTDDDIIAIYGHKAGSDAERIVFADESRIIRPKEREGLLLYAKGEDENPTQMQAVFYVTKVVSIGAAAVAFALVLLLAFLRRRRANAQDATS